MRNAWLLGFAVCAFAGLWPAHVLAHPSAGRYGNDFAVSIERFMGAEFVDWQHSRGHDLRVRALLNADDLTPTSSARVGLDYFIRRLSIGAALGVTSEDSFLFAPRIGYMIGLSRSFGLWLRGGMFVAGRHPDYLGITAEALFHWWIHPNVSFHFGPTLDIGFADAPAPDFVALGIPQIGLSVWF